MKLATRPLQLEFLSSLLLAMAIFTGCGSEMPMPPPRESTNPAEDDFFWAMERMKHAMEMFRPSSSQLRVKRELNYQLIPPSKSETNFTARVTIATKTVFIHDTPSRVQERKDAEEKKAKAAAEKLGLDDPFGPVEDPLAAEDGLMQGNAPLAEVPISEIPDPRLPTHEIKEEKEYLLKYVDDQWRLETSELEDAERMWFDYALQQGEYTPESAKKL
jgi:hypothetical protein